MVHATVEECWVKNTSLTYPSINWEVVRHGAITLHSIFCTRIQAGYHVDEFWGYSAEGQDSPEYISFHRVKHLAEIDIGCQQPSATRTQTFGEETECQGAIYGRLLRCENRLLMAQVVSSF